MGAQQSSDLIEDVKHIKESFSLTRDSVARMLIQINENGLDLAGRELQVGVVGYTDDQLLWRTTIRFKCTLRNPETEEVIQKQLNLRQFIALYQNVAVTKNLMSMSSISEQRGETEEDDLCCVCFERDCQVTLPCTHSFCPSCIQEWQLRSRTCPLCRHESTEEDQWFLEETPDISEVRRELQKMLSNLLRT